jgi:tetratricopeptide (TPR) repeat protein
VKLKIILLTFLITTIGCLSYADSTVSGLVLSNPVLTVIGSNMLNAEELEKTYLEAANDYEQHPEHYKVGQLAGVARGYLAQAKYAQAIPLYAKFLTVQPTNAVAIRELGLCYIKTQNYEAAESEFKKGWMLGDDMALKSLVNAYLISARFPDIKPWVPDLLKARERETDKDYKHEVTNVLIMYSLNASPTTDKKIFLKSIEGLSDEFILEREDTAQAVILGLKTFGYQERADKLAGEMKKAN